MKLDPASLVLALGVSTAIGSCSASSRRGARPRMDPVQALGRE